MKCYSNKENALHIEYKKTDRLVV